MNSDWGQPTLTLEPHSVLDEQTPDRCYVETVTGGIYLVHLFLLLMEPIWATTRQTHPHPHRQGYAASLLTSQAANQARASARRIVE